MTRPATKKKDSGHAAGLSATEAADIRTWLQMVKSVLPMEREINRLFARDTGQSLPRFDVLSQLDRAGAPGLPVGVLAEHLIASAGNITRLIARMEEEDLVHRAPAQGDRRRQLIHITGKGRTVYAAMVALHTNWVNEWLAPLSDAEKATLRTILKKLRENTPRYGMPGGATGGDIGET